MGVMDGAIDFLSELCELPLSRIRKHKKPKLFQTVAMKVRIDCKGCERKIKNILKGMKGVTEAEVDAKQNKVTVRGYVEEAKVMEQLARQAGKKVEPWPYVRWDAVPRPYAPGVYDKKAPPGHVRNLFLVDPTAARLARPCPLEEMCVYAFSDENPNACALM